MDFFRRALRGPGLHGVKQPAARRLAAVPGPIDLSMSTVVPPRVGEWMGAKRQSGTATGKSFQDFGIAFLFDPFRILSACFGS